MKRAASLVCLLIGFISNDCKKQQSFVEPEPGLERMLTQPRVDPFEGLEFYDDGMGMRPPPRGTIPIERALDDAKIGMGIDHGEYVERLPIAVDRQVLLRGRQQFDIFCAACHGISGDGQSVVADNMDLRKPPSLHEERIRAFPAGRLYRVIRIGYGLMPSYAAQLSVEERWGVVAYVRALQLSRGAAAAALPVDLRAALVREAR